MKNSIKDRTDKRYKHNKLQAPKRNVVTFSKRFEKVTTFRFGACNLLCLYRLSVLSLIEFFTSDKLVGILNVIIVTTPY